MGRKRVTNFGLPEDLAAMIDLLRQEAPGMGFGSRTDVVKVALREFLTHLVEMKVLSPHVFTPGFAKRRKTPAGGEQARGDAGV